MQVLSCSLPAERQPCRRAGRAAILLFSGSMVLLGFLGSPARAATLYWDANGVAPVDGGTGVWDTSPPPRWSTTAGGGPYVAWSNATNDDAVFSVAGGYIGLGAPITARSLTFLVSMQILAAPADTLGSSSGTLTLDTATGTSSGLLVQYTPATTTIIKNGSGALFTYAAQTGFTGKWMVNGGVLSISGSAPGDTHLGVAPGGLVADQVTLNGGFLSSSAPVAFSANRGMTLGASGGGFVSAAGSNITWAGPIAGGGSLTKQGASELTLSGNNTYTGSTVISGGSVVAAGVGALGATSSVSVGPSGTLSLTGAGNLNRVNNAAGISLAGGSIVKGSGASEGSDTALGLGILSLGANSGIDFGTGGVGALAFSNFTPAGFSLTINNWTGTAGAVGNASTDRLIFGADQSANLANFSFTGFGSGGSQFPVAAGFEIVPVPEPGAVLAGLLLLVPVAWRERRYLFRCSAARA